MFFSSFKGINRLISKRNVKYLFQVYHWEKLTFSKLRFSKFFSRSVFGELQLTHKSLNFKTSCYNLQVRGLGAKLCAAFLFFNLERDYEVSKSKRAYISLNKNIKFHKNETESKKENPTHSFRDKLFASAHIRTAN